jgi:hypothetical protein
MNASIERFSTSVNTARWSARQVRALAIAAAIVANVVILIVGWLAMGDFPTVTQGGDDQTVGLAQVVVMTGLSGLVAWGVLALLERTTSRATAIWTAIAVVVFVLSLAGPLGNGVDASSKAVLASMHLATAATLIPLMRRSAVTRR